MQDQFLWKVFWEIKTFFKSKKRKKEFIEDTENIFSRTPTKGLLETIPIDKNEPGKDYTKSELIKTISSGNIIGYPIEKIDPKVERESFRMISEDYRKTGETEIADAFQGMYEIIGNVIGQEDVPPRRIPRPDMAMCLIKALPWDFPPSLARMMYTDAVAKLMYGLYKEDPLN
jgi:hypothetical protein